MKQIGTFRHSNRMKLRFFHMTIETILLYECEAWTIIKALKMIDAINNLCELCMSHGLTK